MKKTLQYIRVKFDEPISILRENTSAINISKSPNMHFNTKHIPIKFHFLRYQVKKRNTKLEYVGPEGAYFRHLH